MPSLVLTVGFLLNKFWPAYTSRVATLAAILRTTKTNKESAKFTHDFKGKRKTSGDMRSENGDSKAVHANNKAKRSLVNRSQNPHSASIQRSACDDVQQEDKM